MHPMLHRLDELAVHLAARDDTVALLGLGSAGAQRARLDEHSDLDFLLVVADGAKGRYVDRLDWLEAPCPVAFSFAHDRCGRKALYQNGIFVEYLVVTVADLERVPFTAARVVWRRPGAPPGLTECAAPLPRDAYDTAAAAEQRRGALPVPGGPGPRRRDPRPARPRRAHAVPSRPGRPVDPPFGRLTAIIESSSVYRVEQKIPKWKAVLLDFLERAGWSAGQVFAATLLAGGMASAADLPWKASLTLAGSAFFSSLALTGVQYLARQTNLAFWPDLLTRLGKTFLTSLSASMLTGVFDVTTFDWAAALNVAALATLTAFGKGLLAREPATPDGRIPSGASPSTLPTGTYREAVDPTPASPATGGGSIPDR